MMSTQEKFLYNMVLRQLRDEEYYEDGEEDDGYDPDQDKFFGDGEVEQMEGDAEEDEVSWQISRSFHRDEFKRSLTKFRTFIDGRVHWNPNHAFLTHDFDHLRPLLEEKQAQISLGVRTDSAHRNRSWLPTQANGSR